MQKNKIPAQLSKKLYQVITEIMEESWWRIAINEMNIHDLSFEISEQIKRATEDVVARNLAQSQDSVKQVAKGNGLQ